MSFVFNPFTGNFDEVSDLSTSVGSSPNANASSVSQSGTSIALTLQPADATHPGLLTATSQSIGGVKTFGSLINADAGIDRSTSGTLTIGATNSTVINIGNSGATVNIQGTTIYENTPQLLTSDPLITVNHGGGAGSGQNAGIQIEEASAITGYAETSSDRNSWILKAPNTAGIATITPGVAGITLDQSSHDPVTLGTANGLSLSVQQLSLGLSSTSTTGALSSTDWNTFNNKAPSGNYITALTGDVTATGPGSAAATLATVNSNVGSFSPAAITVNAKGLVTAASSVTTGNITDVGTDGISITGGTGAVLGSGVTISQQVADTTHNGYLSSTDWNTFNNKQAAGNYITALTGDATATGPGSAALTLATVNSNVGTFASVTVNAKGLVTAAANLSGDITTSGSVSTLATVNSNVGSFTYASLTVNAKGLVTAASNGTAPVTTLAAVGASPNANAATISGNTLNLQPFNSTNPGVVTASGGGTTNFLRADGTWAPAGTGTVTSVDMSVPSFLSVSGNPITTSGTLAVSYSGTALPIANGGTAGTSKTAAFDNLSPTTTKGDLIVNNGTNNVRLAVGTNNQVLVADSTQAAGVKWTNSSAVPTAPVVTKYTSGSGTHTLTGSPLYIRVVMVGGGGGGAGSGTTATTGGNGGNTTFGSSLLVANGGNGASGFSAGTGGTASLGTGPVGIAVNGGAAVQNSFNNGAVAATIAGGAGGVSAFGGAGTGGLANAGSTATANSGSGGGGGGGSVSSTIQPGGGGGAGGYVDAIITSPSASYSYAVGSGGTNGSTGVGGFGAGAGGAGQIIVYEYYQ